MTLPNATKKVNRGTPNQSAHAPHNRDSSMRVSPTSSTTARTPGARTSAAWRMAPANRGEVPVRLRVAADPGSTGAGAGQHPHQRIGDVRADAVDAHLNQRQHA